MSNDINNQAGISKETEELYVEDAGVNQTDPNISVDEALIEATIAIAVNRETIFISTLLAKYGLLSFEVLLLYHNLTKELWKKRALGKRDKELLEDYTRVKPQLMLCLNIVEKDLDEPKGIKIRQETQQQRCELPLEPRQTEEAIYEEPIVDHHDGTAAGISVPPLDVRKIFLKPNPFAGDNKIAREWLEDYEVAGQANGWKPNQLAKYFPSFLTDTARTWFVTRAVKTLGPDPSWVDLKRNFMKFYLGTSDTFSIQRQIDEAHQKDGESIVKFLPKMLKLIDLLDPYKAEEQVVNVIRHKLRSYYQRQMAAFDIRTLDQLTEVCLRLEGTSAAARSASVRESKEAERKKESTNKNKATEKQRKTLEGTITKPTTPDKKDIKCFACDRMGHYSNECNYTTKENGQQLNKKREKRRINLIKEETSNDEQQDIMEESQAIATIRTAGQPRINVVMLCGAENKKHLISQDIIINGIETKAIIDTGAKVSVLSEELVKKYDWNLEPTMIRLIGAGGEPLKCIGAVNATIELVIGNKSMATRHTIPVVSGLYFDFLLGIDLMKVLKVIIDVTAERPLSFHRNAIKKGVRVSEDQILDPRSVNLVDVKVNAKSQAIMTRPFLIDDNLLVANSISPVKNRKSVIMLVNIDVVPVKLEMDQQLACFEEIDAEPQSHQINILEESIQIDPNGERINIGRDLTNEQIKELETLLKAHLAAFSLNGQLGLTSQAEHKIVLKEGTKPIAAPLRRRPELHIEEARKQVKEMLAKGIIEPSSSPWGAAYVIVKKKTGEFRFCIDFRGLNAVTKMDSYPLPHIERCIEQVAGNRFFSLLDFASGYWQIPVEEASRDCTAFRTEDGLWRCVRMPFGLCSAPASFQRLMNGLFAGMAGPNLQIFIDDLCLATRTWQEHLNLLDQILRTIEKANLRLKSSKCLIGAREITYLGHRVSAEGIRTDPNKLKALIGLPSPTDVKGIRRALGMFSYYRKFVPRFAIIAEPLTRLSKKANKFVWGIEQENAFRLLISELNKGATLTNIQPTGDIILKTDASIAGVAGILLQIQEGCWKMISCCSRRLSDAEGRYAITDLEALAIVYAVCRFRHFLLGRHFKIVTDHHALCVLTSRNPQNSRLQRWALLLSEFSYEVVYAKGSAHADVDCLSRAPVDNSDPYIEQIFTICVPIDTDEWKSNYIDEESLRALEKAHESYDQYEMRSGIVYWRDKLYVPLNQRMKIIKESHDDTAAHDGVEATLERMKHIWWPQMTRMIKEYIASCEVCQMRKAERKKPSGRMFMHDSTKPLHKVCFDYVGPLPETIHGKRFIALAIDTFSRFIYAKAMKDQTATKFVRFFQTYCSIFGLPTTIVTDNSKTFENREMKEIVRTSNTVHVFAAARHHRGNAPAERAIQSLNEKLAMITKTNNIDWASALPRAIYSINTKLCKSTNFTPYEIMFGRIAAATQTSLQLQDEEYDIEAMFISNREKREIAARNQRKSHESSKRFFEEKRREEEFEIGEKVVVERSDRRQKLSDRFEGPFEVCDKNRDIYKVRNLGKNEIRTKHVSQLKHYKDRNMGVLALTLTLLLICQVNGNELNTVHWTKVDDRFVSPGTQTNRVSIAFVSPCNIIRRFQAVMRINPAMFRFNRSLPVHYPHRNPRQARPVNNQISDSPPQQQQPPKDNVQVAYEHCERTYQEFISVLQKLDYIERERRQILEAMLASAGILYVSNLFTTVEEKLFGKEHNMNDEEKVEIIRKKLAIINEREDLQKIFNQFIQADVHQVMKLLDGINTSVNYLIEIEPEISAVLSVLINKINNKKAIADRVSASILLKSTDMIALGQLVTPRLYYNLHPSDSHVNELRFNTQTRGISVIISGPVRDTNTLVYQVNTLDFITREKQQYFRNTYTGYRWVVRNIMTDCMKAIEPTYSRFIKASCDERGYRDPRLKLWTKSLINRTHTLPATSFIAWPYVKVQCWSNELIITKPFNKTTRCPRMPINVNATWTFATSDGLVNHQGIIMPTSKEGFVEDNMVIAETHHRSEDLDAEVRQDKELDELEEQSKKLSEQYVAIRVGETRINYRHSTVTLLSLLGLLLAFVVFMKILKCVRCVQNMVEIKMPPTNERVRNNDIYAIRMEEHNRRISRS